MSEQRVTAEDLYALRWQMLQAERSALTARQADLELRECLLDIEKRYGILATDSELNVQTGLISRKPEQEKGA